MSEPTPTPDRRAVPVLALRPPEAAQALGISERLLWDMTKRGEVPHLRMGRAVVYPVAALDRWLAERAEAGSAR